MNEKPRVCYLKCSPTLCFLGWDSNHPHGAAGSVHALFATAVRQLSASLHPPPGCVLGGSPAGPHMHRGQSNTQGAGAGFFFPTHTQTLHYKTGGSGEMI